MKKASPRPNRNAPNPRCAWCGLTRIAHTVVNYSDGPWVGEPVYVCPTSIFTLVEDRKDSATKGGS